MNVEIKLPIKSQAGVREKKASAAATIAVFALVAVLSVILGAAIIGTALGLSLSGRKESNGSDTIIAGNIFEVPVTTTLATSDLVMNGNINDGPLSFDFMQLQNQINGRIKTRLAGTTLLLVRVQEALVEITNRLLRVSCREPTCMSARDSELKGLLTGIVLRVNDAKGNPIFIEINGVNSTFGTESIVPNGTVGSIVGDSQETPQLNRSMGVSWSGITLDVVPVLPPLLPDVYAGVPISDELQRNQTIHDLNQVKTNTSTNPHSVEFLNLLGKIEYPTDADAAKVRTALWSLHSGTCTNCTQTLIDALKASLIGKTILIRNRQNASIYNLHSIKNLTEPISFTNMTNLKINDEVDIFNVKREMERTKFEFTLNGICTPDRCAGFKPNDGFDANLLIPFFNASIQTGDSDQYPHSIKIDSFDLPQTNDKISIFAYAFYEKNVEAKIGNRSTYIQSKLVGKSIAVNPQVNITMEKAPKLFTTQHPGLFVNPTEWNTLTTIS